jgi:hypothetical protein
VGYLTATGRLERAARGVYRLSSFRRPAIAYVIEAYLRLGLADATVTHTSALEVIGLKHPQGPPVHITVPRERRSTRPPEAVRLHTISRRWKRSERVRRHGLLVTAPVESLIDAVRGGISDEDLKEAIHRGVETRVIHGPSLGEQAFLLSWADTTRIWDRLPPQALNECLIDRLGRLADGRGIKVSLLDPGMHADGWSAVWRLLVHTRIEPPDEVQWEIHDLFVHEVDWPLSRPPDIAVEFTKSVGRLAFKGSPHEQTAARTLNRPSRLIRS